MRQRAPDAAIAQGVRPVQAYHRSALGQAIAFEHRQAERAGALQQAGPDAATADRDVTQ